jgi:hypothetical protein
VRFADGGLVVLTLDGTLHRFVHDPLDGGAYPADPHANDPVIATPCDAGVNRFWSSPEGQLVIECTDATQWLDGQPFMAGGELIALGYGGMRLVQGAGGTVIVNGANSTPISFSTNVSVSTGGIRATATGFGIVGEAMDGGCALYTFDSAGGRTVSGFAPAPAGLTTPCTAGELALAADWTLYTTGDLANDAGTVIVSRTGATSAIAYTPPLTPPDFTTGSVFLGPPFALKTGP